MAHTVIGFFKNSTDAYEAVDVLKSKGFDIMNIDVSSGYGSNENTDETREHSGKVGNFFKSLFGNDDDDAERYSQVARNNSMITVHTFSDDEAERAADILDDCGALDIDETGYSDSSTEFAHGVSRRTGDTGTAEYTSDTVTGDYTGSTTDFTRDKDYERNTESSIPIIEEQVNVGKREVRRGGVRVRSRIIERPVEETLRLREERVHVERNPVNREASEADLQNFREETIEVNEYGEEAVVSKQARVVEEVRVGKEVEERTETIRDTERKTEVDVENLSKSSYDKD